MTTTEQDAAMQAHVEKVIASDGVDDSRAVEVMARAFTSSLAHQDGYEGDEPWPLEPDGSIAFLDQSSPNMLVAARAALGALRALEGE